MSKREHRKDFSEEDEIGDYWKNSLAFMAFVSYSLFIANCVMFYLITKLGIILKVLFASLPYFLIITGIALLLDKRSEGD